MKEVGLLRGEAGDAVLQGEVRAACIMFVVCEGCQLLN